MFKSPAITHSTSVRPSKPNTTDDQAPVSAPKPQGTLAGRSLTLAKGHEEWAQPPKSGSDISPRCGTQLRVVSTNRRHTTTEDKRAQYIKALVIELKLGASRAHCAKQIKSTCIAQSHTPTDIKKIWSISDLIKTAQDLGIVNRPGFVGGSNP